jgi:hypothetical protein
MLHVLKEAEFDRARQTVICTMTTDRQLLFVQIFGELQLSPK